jgi:hypothetical protein
MKTTITLQPQQQTVSAPFIPPTITQYPPKPLVYSPVEPMHEPITQSKQLFHRISMPLLKSSNQHHHSEHPNTSRPTRRRSEPDNQNKVQFILHYLIISLSPFDTNTKKKKNLTSF